MPIILIENFMYYMNIKRFKNMYTEFKNNLMTIILTHHIVNIYMDSGEKVVIGVGGSHKSDIRFKPFGFYIKTISASIWYSYAHICKIEVY